MSLSPEERTRYRRQLLLADIGGQGQAALKAARIVVIGAGGLGCPILLALSAAGVGRIDVIDGDVVELSNLNRQTLFTPMDIGKPKAEVAACRLSAFNPYIDVQPHTVHVDAGNAERLLAGASLVVEGVDRFAPRYTINTAMRHLNQPWISSAVGPFSGQVALFDPRDPACACYACFIPEAPTDAALCESEGILGTTTAIVGTMAADEAIKLLTGMPTLSGRMIIYDGKSGTTRKVRLSRDPACPVCGAA